MATKTDELITPDRLAAFASRFRRKSAEATVKAKATKDATEKVLLARSATSADVLASHFERQLAEAMTEKATAG